MADLELLCPICHDAPANHPVRLGCCNNVFCTECLRNFARFINEQQEFGTDRCMTCNEPRLHGEILLDCPVCTHEFMYKEPIKLVPALMYTILILILVSVSYTVLISTFMGSHRIGLVAILYGTGNMMRGSYNRLYEDFYLYRSCTCQTKHAVTLCFGSSMCALLSVYFGK